MRRAPGSLASRLALIAVAGSLVSGCSRRPKDATPEGTVEAFLEAVDTSAHDPSAIGRAYALLATPARDALKERAEHARRLGIGALGPEAMLAPTWSTARFTVDRLRARIDGDGVHATVDVYGIDEHTQHTVVMTVREGEAWRIALDVPPLAPTAASP